MPGPSVRSERRPADGAHSGSDFHASQGAPRAHEVLIPRRLSTLPFFFMSRRLLRIVPAGIVYGEFRTEVLMMSLWKRRSRFLLPLLFPLGLPGLPAHPSNWQPCAVQQGPQAATTVRVSVGLVQTDVMVFDRRGRFVPDLRLEQFELQVDGKRQQVYFRVR